jgi:hypothetical protein
MLDRINKGGLLRTVSDRSTDTAQDGIRRSTNPHQRRYPATVFPVSVTL